MLCGAAAGEGGRRVNRLEATENARGEEHATPAVAKEVALHLVRVRVRVRVTVRVKVRVRVTVRVRVRL